MDRIVLLPILPVLYFRIKPNKYLYSIYRNNVLISVVFLFKNRSTNYKLQ